MKNCDRCDNWFHEECENFKSSSQIKLFTGYLLSEIKCYCSHCYDGLNINVIPNQILRQIFLGLCVEDERMRGTIALFCRSWHALTDTSFRDAVHNKWLDKEFKARNWSAEMRKKHRKWS